MSNRKTIDERPTKKLRSSEPDLQIILGSGDDKSTQFTHSTALALKSKYVDTMLSTPMREQETHTITFPDITPTVWETMNKFLDDPLAAREMKAEDVRDVAVPYDKYEFTQGSKLCEKIMSDYLSAKSLAARERSFTLDLDLVIDLTIIAHKANLSTPFAKGCKYLSKKLGSFSKYQLDLPYCNAMFTEEHLKKIFPVLKHTPLPNDYISNIRRILSEKISESDNEVFEQPGAEKRYISYSSNMLNRRLVLRCIHSIELCGTGINADGLFAQEDDYDFDYRGGDRTAEWFDGRGEGNHIYNFAIRYTNRGEEDGWAIVRYRYLPNQEEDDYSPIYKICWWAPYSKQMDTPPLKGWVPHDPLARGNPWLKYNLKETIE